MTSQEIFDAVALHLLNQNAIASDGGPILACRYRAASGLRCAIGGLIPDTIYERYPNIEGKRVNTLPAELFYDMGILYDPGTLELLERLQDVHDEHDPEQWASALLGVAESFGLSGRVVTEFRAC